MTIRPHYHIIQESSAVLYLLSHSIPSLDVGLFDVLEISLSILEGSTHTFNLLKYLFNKRGKRNINDLLGCIHVCVCVCLKCNKI